MTESKLRGKELITMTDRFLVPHSGSAALPEQRTSRRFLETLAVGYAAIVQPALAQSTGSGFTGEAGQENVLFLLWHGIVAPPGTPDAVVSQHHVAFDVREDRARFAQVVDKFKVATE